VWEHSLEVTALKEQYQQEVTESLNTEWNGKCAVCSKNKMISLLVI
jgi:hypothetical protein